VDSHEIVIGEVLGEGRIVVLAFLAESIGREKR
jgi:hypothetical protein